jgi:phage shock protein C
MNDKKITRSSNDRMFLGVAGGLAAYLKIDPVLVRLFFVLLTLSTGYGVIVYILLALLMPEDQPVAKANGFNEEEIIIKDAA